MPTPPHQPTRPLPFGQTKKPALGPVFRTPAAPSPVAARPRRADLVTVSRHRPERQHQGRAPQPAGTRRSAAKRPGPAPLPLPLPAGQRPPPAHHLHQLPPALAAPHTLASVLPGGKPRNHPPARNLCYPLWPAGFRWYGPSRSTAKTSRPDHRPRASPLLVYVPVNGAGPCACRNSACRCRVVLASAVAGLPRGKPACWFLAGALVGGGAPASLQCLCIVGKYYD